MAEHARLPETPPPAGTGASGIALVVVVVLLLALTVLGHGVLVLARAEARGVEAFGRATRGRLLARASLQAVFGSVVDDTLPALAVAAADTATTSPGGRRIIERLSSELHLVTAQVDASEGAPGGEPVSAATRSGVAWAADPVTRVARIVGVLSTGGALTGAERVQASDFFGVEPRDAPWCDPFAAALDSLASRRPPPDAVGALAVDPGAAEPPGPAARSALSLGMLDTDTLLARLDSHPGGVVTPEASSGLVACSEGPDNWGSPSEPEGPCGGRRVALHVEGALTLDGGEGQGILAVTGDLVLRSGAAFSGFVLVGGDLDVREAASIRGAARVGGDATISSDALVLGAACPVVAALAAAPGLRRPIGLPAPLSSLR